MATQDGPQYPGIEDGLVFCFDPKNRDCWNGGVNFNDLNLLSPTNEPISNSLLSQDQFFLLWVLFL